jgi:type II secretory pathway pseudopilin PulG
MSVHGHMRRGLRRSESGYVLLTLILMVSLLIIAAAAIAPSIAFEIRRDREEEMIHRGVQYSRAIRIYYKKFGRYPAKLEDLENSNNYRCLRQRYKDPITGKDFKILHFGEVKMTFSAPLAGAASVVNGALQPNGNAPFGQPQQGFGAPAGALGGPSGAFGNASGFAAAARPGTTPDSATNADQNQAPGQGQTSADQSSTDRSGQLVSQSGVASQQTDPVNAQVFGGMPIVGVVSTSKKEGVREFNHKKKYSEWQFIYDPGTDRGGLLMTPNQPPLQGFANQQLQPGQQGNTSSNPFGPQPAIGNSSPFGNNPSGYNNNPNPAPNPPPSNPQNPQ